MKRSLRFIVPAMLVFQPTATLAQDRIVDVASAKAVAALLQEAGYKAIVKKHDQKGLYVESAANGSTFSINFYGCKNDLNCDSFEFHSWYKKQPYFSTALVNNWNLTKRFMKIAIDSDGDLNEYIYVSSVGKMTYENFVDYIEWFTYMDGELNKFLFEKSKEVKK